MHKNHHFRCQNNTYNTIVNIMHHTAIFYHYHFLCQDIQIDDNMYVKWSVSHYLNIKSGIFCDVMKVISENAFFFFVYYPTFVKSASLSDAFKKLLNMTKSLWNWKTFWNNKPLIIYGGLSCFYSIGDIYLVTLESKITNP